MQRRLPWLSSWYKWMVRNSIVFMKSRAEAEVTIFWWNIQSGIKIVYSPEDLRTMETISVLYHLNDTFVRPDAID